jgi:hypothetical protein
LISTFSFVTLGDFNPIIVQGSYTKDKLLLEFHTNFSGFSLLNFKATKIGEYCINNGLFDFTPKILFMVIMSIRFII